MNKQRLTQIAATVRGAIDDYQAARASGEAPAIDEAQGALLGALAEGVVGIADELAEQADRS
jgi:hypothetical protein